MKAENERASKILPTQHFPNLNAQNLKEMRCDVVLINRNCLYISTFVANRLNFHFILIVTLLKLDFL